MWNLMKKNHVEYRKIQMHPNIKRYIWKTARKPRIEVKETIMCKTKEYKLHITEANKNNTVLITKIMKLNKVYFTF
jgi:hypothetical protein